MTFDYDTAIALSSQGNPWPREPYDVPELLRSFARFLWVPRGADSEAYWQALRLAGQPSWSERAAYLREVTHDV
jgi:hypothetical protein